MKKVILVVLAFSIWGCKKASEDTSYSVDTTAESAQQVGDAMASVDESGGSTSGAIAYNEMKSTEKAFARLSPNDISVKESFWLKAFPQAEATACNAVAFSACASNQKVRTLDGCTTAAGGTMSGNVSLTFSGTGAASCTLPMAADAVSRVPNHSITGLRGATFSVSASSSGQTLTRTGASTFTFANSGIRRTFVTPKGVTLLDVSTSTASPITVTGNSRNTRTMSGGTLTVLNNLTSVSCSLTPTSVAWTSACNCPTAGYWSGTCSDSSSFRVDFSSTCGAATVTKDGATTSLTMDRCQL